MSLEVLFNEMTDGEKSFFPHMAQEKENIFSDELVEIVKYQPIDPKVIVQMPNLKEIQSFMKCGSCQRIPTADGFVCSNDHLICRNCASVAKKLGMICPIVNQSDECSSVPELCKAKLQAARLGPLMKIFQLAKYECPAANCDVTGLSAIEMNEHTQVCKFRFLVSCPEILCKNERIPLVSYISHLKEHHHVPKFEEQSCRNFIVNLPYSKDRQNEKWCIAILEAHGQHFIIRVEHKEDNFTFAALLLDSRAQKPNKHDHFQVKFEIKSAYPEAEKDLSTESLKWIGPVYPFLQDIEDTGNDDDKDNLDFIMNFSPSSQPELCLQLIKDFVYFANPLPRPAPYTVNLSVTILKRFSFKESPKFRKFSARFI